MTTRREKLRQATLDEIKSIAWDLLRQNQTVTIHSITRQMGMTAPAFYTYFKNRDSLMTELVRDSLEAFYTALTAPFSSEESRNAATVLFTTFVRYRQWAVTHPSAFSLFAGRPVSGKDADDGTTAMLAERGYTLFFDLFKQAEQTGELKFKKKEFSCEYTAMMAAVRDRIGIDVRPELIHLVIQLTGLVHGLISMELSNRFSHMIENGELMFKTQLATALQQAGLNVKALP